MEAVRLATLAERTRLENLQHSLDERARRLIAKSSRRPRQLFPPETQVFRTPIQNLAAAARIAESIQPSRSEAGRGLEQIRTLLRAAGDQNFVVFQSRNRIHSKSVRGDTVQSAHSPRSPLRHGGRDHRQDRHLGRAHGEYDREYARDNHRRAPSPLPRDGSYAPRRYDDRRPYGNDRRVPVDPREPGFDARSVLVRFRFSRRKIEWLRQRLGQPSR